jgi:hypothetical protein
MSEHHAKTLAEGFIDGHISLTELVKGLESLGLMKPPAKEPLKDDRVIKAEPREPVDDE